MHNVITGLEAVVLIVEDLEAQTRFYRDLLGLEIVGDYGDAVFFGCGAQKLALFAMSHHPEGTRRLKGASKGLSHLEFRIRPEDYEPVKERLTEAGCLVRADNFEDADGNLFHFVFE